MVINCREEGEEKQWGCGRAGVANLQRVGSIVRDIGEPCLSQSPIKVVLTVSRMLKQDKWQGTLDSKGKVFGFRKVLKLIILGGVDQSIRPEVWEFLLGCYALGSSAEYRKQLRSARRERYNDLLKQCQTMHSSIGTGSLAYVVGSKVMDMRISSKDDGASNTKVEGRQDLTANNTNTKETYCESTCTDASCTYERESSSDSVDLVSLRGSTDDGAYDASCFLPPHLQNCSSPNQKIEAGGSQFESHNFYDFPQLPVTDLFRKSGDDSPSKLQKLSFEEGTMHAFQIDSNVDLVIESNGSCSKSNSVSCQIDSEIEMVLTDATASAPVHQSNSLAYKTEVVQRLRMSDARDSISGNATSQPTAISEDKVSEWLWTLHLIVVDVVRTDSHLEFYEDMKNIARMSDILAVYAWVNPATGYCQGMSDLLSPFVVLFEDDADAFWCFEMLLRRMRENFQMEGPTGVMKQLQTLWHILELTDREMFAHLSRIGAESLHFAFRMLMVLFRRELSFTETLCMWEMMWAADFDESTVSFLEANCLDALVLHQFPTNSDNGGEKTEEDGENSNGSSKGGSQTKNVSVEQSSDGAIAVEAVSPVPQPFCGLTRSFWPKNDRMQICSSVSSTRNGEDELPVFCVAAILIINRNKIIRETRSIDDMIKIFNDKKLKIHVKRCVRSAIKLRKKYFYKLIKIKNPASQHDDQILTSASTAKSQ